MAESCQNNIVEEDDKDRQAKNGSGNNSNSNNKCTIIDAFASLTEEPNKG